MSGRRLTSDEVVRRRLHDARTIAVVGLSPRAHRPSHGVARYLQEVGYRILPVNPNGGESILGERVYPGLSSLPGEPEVDVVDVFRRSETLSELVTPLLSLRPRLVWLQLGVTDRLVQEKLMAGGIDLVVDQCLAVEHRRLFSGRG